MTGAIQSTSVNFIKDLPYFVALLVAFQRFTLSDWGIEVKLCFRPSNGLYTAIPVEFGDGFFCRASLEEDMQRWSPSGLVGRGIRVLTACVHAAGETLRKAAAVKFYWPESTRTSEVDILQAAYAVDSDLTRGHLPELLAHRDLGHSTADIRTALGIVPRQDSLHREPRIYRVLVFAYLDEDYGWSVIGTFMQFWVEWCQCAPAPSLKHSSLKYRCKLILGHRVPWVNGIEHGNISLDNLMVKYDRGKQTTAGVLNDSNLKKNQLLDKRQIGAAPFMALDLLRSKEFRRPVVRFYRHDLESFIWVLVFATLDHCTLAPQEYDLGV
ncbi:hypothetical protein H0H81_002881 [Sphagnurus paluster]|uniref:Fungal-type protein kinase domain-containing protein n=1 Tax=Sphagnurus paluster TaxID=117069 RepID=A0A9P7KHD0_9AGAR|nr:hypothetical protein H0H81_002881 [Sphagnurus paluster]